MSIGSFLLNFVKASAGFVWRLGPRVASLLFVVALVFLILFAVLDTRRDVAYRYSAPGSAECAARLSPANSTVLASEGIDNDERLALRQVGADDPNRDHAFTCMLQLHAMRPGFIAENPDTRAGNPSLGYYLSFLEFEENGNPAQIGRDGKLLERLQLDALIDHLNGQRKAGRQNFVFAFVHGWRHDARIGDANVQNVRLMAAHLASFLEQRCRSAGRYCGATATAVYVGWRGARVDERRLDWLLGGHFSGLTSTIGNVLASMTLFDRKPVSERIAPSVVSALREVERRIHTGDEPADWFDRPRMIVVGHSLGGNLLATALQDTMIGIVDKNLDAIARAGDAANGAPRPLLKSPLGDLVVLLNPASEAEKWTSIQRAFSRRINAPVDTKDVQDAYALNQRPIYLSLTAARSWPANGIHLSDVSGFARNVGPQVQNPCAIIRKVDSDYKPSYDYDSATYDLFPFFKMDFRPLAQTIEDWSDPDPFACNDRDGPERPGSIKRLLWRQLAAALRNVPFMDTDIERTRTIGHVDPMRASYGHLNGIENDPATWIGTTHELLINAQRKQRPPGEETPQSETASYLDAASPERSECAIVDHWLTTARTKYAHVQRKGGALVNWDSGWSSGKTGKMLPGDPTQPNLTRIRFRPDDPASHIEGQIRQTLFFAGMRSITGAHDPFWNVRAFESAMTSHNGYVSYPLICSIFQFVMDEITDDAAGSPPWPSQVAAPGPADVAKPAPTAEQMADYQGKLAAYDDAWQKFRVEADPYWGQIKAKRAARNAKRRAQQPILLDDYVLTEPPEYSGPKKPVDPSLAAQPAIGAVPVVADFLKNAAEQFQFVPRRPETEIEFKKAYASVAAAAGLTRDQAVRIYGFEAGGNGKYDVQAGLEVDRPGAMAITTALGYNQLLATNSVELLAEQGDQFVKQLKTRAGQLSGAQQADLAQKIAVLEAMIAYSRTVADDWGLHQKLAGTPKGLAIHALNLDLDIGPLLQTQKLMNSVNFAKQKGDRAALTAAELEMMNLTGDGNGFDMVSMPQDFRVQVPTSNFFDEGGYGRNPVAKRNDVVSKLLAATDAVMDRESQLQGAKDLAAAF